jgi:3-dehydroquinate dehydratase type I
VTLRICVSILPKNNLDALNLIEKAEKAHADLIEVRFDCFETTRNLAALAKSTSIPLIATNKLQSEKGFFAGTEAQRQEILLNAAKAGFAYVDVDVSSPKELIRKLKQLGTKPIVSYHKHDGALSAAAMEKILKQQIASGAEVCKIITTATKPQDNLSALTFVSANADKTRLVCFCMGEQGKISRLLSPMFGAYFTFASLEQGNETAKGQMTIEQMWSAYSVLGAK